MHIKTNISLKTPLSLNQEFFLNEPSACGTLGPYQLGTVSKEELETLLLNFLELNPVLRVNIYKENGVYVQETVEAHNVKYTLKFTAFTNAQTHAELRSDVLEYIHQPYHFDGGELIRLYALVDAGTKEVTLVMGIHHILTDMFTNNRIEENLIRFFKQETIVPTTITNHDFQIWQQKFISSAKAQVSRNFWKKFITAENCQEFHWTPQVKNKKGHIACRVYTLEVADEYYSEVQTIFQQLNIPVSAFFMTIHQQLIREIFETVKGLQLIRVNGREQTIDGFDIKNVHGSVGNTIAIPIQANDENFKKNALKVFTQYCKARMHQIIPYALLKKDIQEAHSVDIDKSSFGIYNFKAYDKKLNTPQKINESETTEYQNSNSQCNLEIINYTNAIRITFSLAETHANTFLENFNLLNFITRNKF